MAVSSLSAMFYSIIYSNLFVTNPDEYDENAQDLAGFWWFMTAFVGIVCFIGALHVRVWEVFPEENIDEGTQDAPNIHNQVSPKDTVHQAVVPAASQRQLQRVVSEPYESVPVRMSFWNSLYLFSWLKSLSLSLFPSL